MARKNQRKNPRSLNAVNYYETTGSANPRPDEASAVLDSSMDAVEQNMQTKRAQPDQINP